MLLKVHGTAHLLGGKMHAVGCGDQLVLHVVGAVNNAHHAAGIALHGLLDAQKIDVQLLAVPAEYPGNIAVIDGVDQLHGVLLAVHVADGTVDLDGDELPSRRALSALLGVNPNTIQKAYRILDDEGLIESRAGAKSCMCIDDNAKEAVRESLVESEVLRAIASLRQMGLSAEQAAELLKKHWNDHTEEVEL